VARPVFKTGRAGQPPAWKVRFLRRVVAVPRDPDSFIATAIYEAGAALERQESLPEVHRVMAMLPESLVAPPERTIFDAALDPTLV
jgi:hypothetical protein